MTLCNMSFVAVHLRLFLPAKGIRFYLFNHNCILIFLILVFNALSLFTLSLNFNAWFACDKQIV